MVFALQKYGFCRAKRWFLHCKKVVFVLPTINILGTTTVLVLYEHYVTANRSPRNWQTVRSIIAIRSQPYGPIYRARIYECTHKMSIRQQPYGRIYRARVYENTHKMGDECTFAMKFMYIFNDVEIRI